MSSLDFAVDHARATVTVTSFWPAEPQRLWEIWADPRRLERWWGPPMYPATVFAHDFSEGGIVSYYMTSPEGEKFPGGWRILKIQAPRLLEFEDYFADEDGNENPNLPRSRTTVAIEARSNAPTQMTMTTRYSSDEELRQVLEMGVQEGLTLAMGQDRRAARRRAQAGGAVLVRAQRRAFPDGSRLAAPHRRRRHRRLLRG